MRRRSGATSIAANPVLIGAATTLVVIIAVFLAYNANSGLPFVPTYDINVEVPDAAGLVVGNDVRVGGTRVGTISAIRPQTLEDGGTIAVLDVKLETVVEPLPDDTTVLIRPRSALGLKYVELTRGTGGRDIPNGGTLALRQATPEPVELDEFFDTFDAETRRSAQANLTAFGNSLAGRGADLNFTLQELGPLLDEFEPVMKNLASADTDLAGFIDGLAQSAAAVAPVAETQASVFVNLNRTFQALADVARPYIQETIAEGPETLAVATDALPRLRPFLANSEELFTALQPGIAALADAAPDLAETVEVGTPVLERSPAFNERVADTLKAVETFSTDPVVKLGVQDLTSTATILEPTIAYITPSQTVCNYLTLWFRNVASLLSEYGTNGSVQRFSIIAAPGGLQPAPNNEGGPSSAPANGPSTPGFDPANYLHSNPYPFTAAPGQPYECEAGNERFITGRPVIGNPPGDDGTLHDDTKPTREP